MTVIEGASETLLPLPLCLPLSLPADGSCAALQSFDRRCSAPKIFWRLTDLFLYYLLSLSPVAGSVCLFCSLSFSVAGKLWMLSCTIAGSIAVLLISSVEFECTPLNQYTTSHQHRLIYSPIVCGARSVEASSNHAFAICWRIGGIPRSISNLSAKSSATLVDTIHSPGARRDSRRFAFVLR